MNKFIIILLNLLLFSPVFAGNITQQDIPVFTDQDLEKYKEVSGSNLSPLHEQEKNEVIENDFHEGAENQGRPVTEAKDEINESEKKAIESELNRIVSSMKFQLEAGNIEGALVFFFETKKEIYRQIFKAMKDNNTLKAAFEGYVGVELKAIYDHSAQCEFLRKEKGELFSYPISFIEYEKGLWQIYNF
jgi:hypothetical protein